MGELSYIHTCIVLRISICSLVRSVTSGGGGILSSMSRVVMEARQCLYTW
jgi:hypothetical protein